MNGLHCIPILVIIFIINILQVSAQPIQDNFVTFGKSIYGISIKHPSDWEVKEYDRTLRDDRTGYDSIASLCPKSDLEFTNTDSNTTSCPTEKQVFLAVRNLPGNSTQEELIEYLDISGKFEFTAYNLTGFANTTLAGFPALRTTYTYLGEYKNEDEIIKALEFIILKENRAYGITYFAPLLEFDDLLPIVQKITNSLMIGPMPPCKFVLDEYGGRCTLSPSSN